MMIKCIVAILAIWSLNSCKNEPYSAVFTSPDKNTDIVVSANKESIGSWRVVISIKSKSFDPSSLTFELYQTSLKGNIDINWLDNGKAEIRFKQMNGSSRIFSLISTENRLFLGEISSSFCKPPPYLKNNHG